MHLKNLAKQQDEEAARKKRENAALRKAARKARAKKEAGGGGGGGEKVRGQKEGSKKKTPKDFLVRPGDGDKSAMSIFFEAFQEASRKKTKAKEHFAKKREKARKKAEEVEAKAKVDVRSARMDAKALEAANQLAESVAGGSLTGVVDKRGNYHDLPAAEKEKLARMEAENQARNEAIHGPARDFSDLRDEVRFGEQAQTVPSLTISHKWSTRSTAEKNTDIVSSALRSSNNTKAKRKKRKRKDGGRGQEEAGEDDEEARRKREKKAAKKKRKKNLEGRKVVPESVQLEVQRQYRIHRQLQAQRRQMGQ